MVKSFEIGTLVYKTIPDKFDGKKWHYKIIGPFKIICHVEKNYIAVKAKGGVPFIISKKSAIFAEEEQNDKH